MAFGNIFIEKWAKIASITLSGNGLIEKLVVKAKNNDHYLFEIKKKILKLAENLSLKPIFKRLFS